MADKFIFSLEIFFLGFSVVMVVLFSLYGLINLFNSFSARPLKKEKKEEEPLMGEAHGEEPLMAEAQEELSPQVAAAIAAALNYHRSSAPCPAAPMRIRVDLEGLRGSHWTLEGRKALQENRLQLDISRRKRT